MAAGFPQGAFALSEAQVEASHSHEQMILCCECGVPIPPNPAAMCSNCIRSRVDITEGIPKQATIYFCRGCGRYLSPPQSWISAELESRELLALCLKRLKGLNKVRLVDAGFIWTEPHSRRVKVKLTIQKEVLSGAILQQVFVTEFTVGHQFCDDCHRNEASDTWNAVVQLRQKVRHKKTFFHLEQLIIKHNAHKQTIKIANSPDGIDFYYANKGDAKRMLDFLMAVVPARFKTSERLISHDLQSNIYNYKYTFSVEIAPICKDDVVCMSRSLSRHLGGISPLAVCTRVGQTLHLVDPLTLQHCDITSQLFWRYPFNSLATHGGLIEYVVLDIEPLIDAQGQPVMAGKFMLAEAQVARERDLGANDQQFVTRTHLGHILQPGDLAWGFDLTSANLNDDNASKLKESELPDVVLVKKSYTDRQAKRKVRRWKLKTLPKEEGLLRKDEEEAQAAQFEAFMRDIEEDREYRSQFNLYKNPGYEPTPESLAASEVSRDGLDPTHIRMAELMDEFDDMELEGDDGPDEGDAEAAMVHDAAMAAGDDDDEEL